MARGEGYVGFVMPSPGPLSQEAIARPLVKEIAERGLALIEITPAPGASALYQLSVELGVGYARSSTVLDYKLAGQGISASLNAVRALVLGGPTLDRVLAAVAWTVGITVVFAALSVRRYRRAA